MPLKRALCLIHKKISRLCCRILWHFVQVCRQFNIVFRCLMKWQRVWRCKFRVIASLGF
ncbi:disulfide bond formation protein DsbD [Vibrio cholerae]|nr:disulfide bond formation protein DsbD [Vibrio cholerae]MCD6648243.1 disulfide bond formation protein DsbD [Vibrio cholerae]